MQILIAILTLMVIIIGVILNRITLYSIRKNTERARDIATIMQHTLNENNYVTKLSLKERRADNMYGDFLPPEGMTYEESLLYVHPEDKHNYQNFMIRLIRGEKSTETCYRWDKSLSLHLGDWHYMRVVGVGEYDESDSKVPLHLYCTLYDETEQRLEQKEEMDLTDRYRKLFEQSIVGQALSLKRVRIKWSNLL